MWKTVIKNLIFFTVNTDRTSPSQFVNHNIFRILNHSSPCILGNNIITYLLMYWVWWIAINVDLESLFGMILQKLLYTWACQILWISISFMHFHIFHGFPYIFMELTEFYKILQLLTIINKEDTFSKYFWKNYNTQKTTLEKITTSK